ncbi:MAG TPA: imelysin family protein [Pseudomonadales bacterium]
MKRFASGCLSCVSHRSGAAWLARAVLGLFAGAAFAQPNTNWTEVNLAVTDAHVIPAYEAFARASAGLETDAAAFCMAPDAPAFATLQASFHTAMDGWQGAQHIQFGPITYFNWNFRIQYWPDDNGTGARQLNALIAAQDAAALDDEAFDRQSVGVQGFQALESLLFDDDSLAQLQGDAYRCQVMHTIAANIDEIASGVSTRWKDEFRTTVANADERGFFESAEDATIDYLKALVEPVRRIQEQKLDAVLGETPEAARERRAESWRSQRTLRNIKLNVAALEHEFTASEPALSSVLHEADVGTIAAAFADLRASIDAQPDSLAEALAADGGHAALLQVSAQLDVLYEAMEAALKNTDLYLGFNSLDGD